MPAGGDGEARRPPDARRDGLRRHQDSKNGDGTMATKLTTTDDNLTI
jgi:hypothetical protein